MNYEEAAEQKMPRAMGEDETMANELEKCLAIAEDRIESLRQEMERLQRIAKASRSALEVLRPDQRVTSPENRPKAR